MLIRNEEDTAWDESTDIVVVGAGGCGLVAAVAASQFDVEIIILEKEEEIGGNTVLSTGGIKGAGTEMQKQIGIEDNSEKYANDILSQNDHAGDEELIKAITQESPKTINWLVNEIGVDLQINPGDPIPGHSVRRTHWPVNENGDITRTCKPVTEHLKTVLEKSGIDIKTAVGVEQLVINNEGEIVGVRTEAHRKPLGRSQQTAIRTKKTLLATNGFGANDDLLSDHIPETVDMIYWGAQGSTGEAIKWGEKLNVEVENTTSYLTYPAVSLPEEVWLPAELINEGAFVVNKNGNRFGDIGAQPYPAFAVKMLQQPDQVAFEIFDQEIFDRVSDYALSQERFANAIEHNVFKKGDTIGELGKKLELDSASLESTLTEINSHIKKETESEFGRSIEKILNPPFYGTKIAPCLAETQGGVKVNENAQVLRRDGTPVTNLFAGGSATNGITGNDPAGYLPGNGLLTALNLGKIMGETAAKQIITQ